MPVRAFSISGLCSSCRTPLRFSLMVTFPMGATQGTATALGYSQSWTMSGGSTGELYLSKLEKKLLGVGSKLGAHSPLEDLC